MSDLLDILGSGLGYLGESLAKPGRSVRGLLAGRPDELASLIPFSDSLGITDPSRAVWGRDLLNQWNMGTGDEIGDTALGFGLDLATDPLTYFGGALARGAFKGIQGATRLGRGQPIEEAIAGLTHGPAVDSSALGALPSHAREHAAFVSEMPSAYEQAAQARWRDLMARGEAGEDIWGEGAAADRFYAQTHAAFPGAEVTIQPAADPIAGLLQQADEFHPPPPLTNPHHPQIAFGSEFDAPNYIPPSPEAENAFRFPLGGARNPYGEGSVVHDMMLEGVNPLDRQSAITQAWDDALGRVPPRPKWGQTETAVAGEAGPFLAWQSQFEHPLVTRLAEAQAFDQAARAGLYGEPQAAESLLSALNQQIGSLSSTLGIPTPTSARNLYEATGGTHYGISGLEHLLQGDIPPQAIGRIAKDVSPGTEGRFLGKTHMEDDIGSLLENPSLAPGVGTAKKVAGNARADRMRSEIIRDAEYARDMTAGSPQNEARDYAASIIKGYGPQTPFIKGAVRSDAEIGPLLQEIYRAAGQTPPKWAIPKAVSSAAAAEEVAAMPRTIQIPPASYSRMPPGLDRAPLPEHVGYRPFQAPAGMTEEHLPAIADLPYTPDHPDYGFAFLRALRANMGETGGLRFGGVGEGAASGMGGGAAGDIGSLKALRDRFGMAEFNPADNSFGLVGKANPQSADDLIQAMLAKDVPGAFDPATMTGAYTAEPGAGMSPLRRHETMHGLIESARLGGDSSGLGMVARLAAALPGSDSAGASGLDRAMGLLLEEMAAHAAQGRGIVGQTKNMLPLFTNPDKLGFYGNQLEQMSPLIAALYRNAQYAPYAAGALGAAGAGAGLAAAY